VVKPAYTAAIALQQTRTVQNERACTDPNQRHPGLCCPMQEAGMVGVEVFKLLHQPPHDNNVVKARGITQPFLGLNRYTAA